MKPGAVKLRLHITRKPTAQSSQTGQPTIAMIRDFLSTEFLRLNIRTAQEPQLPRRFIGYLHTHPEILDGLA